MLLNIEVKKYIYIYECLLDPINIYDLNGTICIIVVNLQIKNL